MNKIMRWILEDAACLLFGAWLAYLAFKEFSNDHWVMSFLMLLVIVGVKRTAQTFSMEMKRDYQGG